MKTKTLQGFKVGDRVRLIDEAEIDGTTGLSVGDVGIVRGIEGESLFVKFPGVEDLEHPVGFGLTDVVRCNTARRYTPAQLASKLRKLVAKVDAATWARIERSISAAA